MNKRIFLYLSVMFLLIPYSIFSITLVRVGYLDLAQLIQTYTTRYMETEIVIRENYINQLQKTYIQNYNYLSVQEKIEFQNKMRDQKDVLEMLRYNAMLWGDTGDIRDEIIDQIVQRDIMNAIKKTSEMEGFNLILDKTGNFIFGSEDINLTEKVLFRLEEKLLDIQSGEPVVPLTLELEEEAGILSDDY